MPTNNLMMIIFRQSYFKGLQQCPKCSLNATNEICMCVKFMFIDCHCLVDRFLEPVQAITPTLYWSLLSTVGFEWHICFLLYGDLKDHLGDYLASKKLN